MIRWGLCCTFREAPITFANTTVATANRLSRPALLDKLSALCEANAESLMSALRYCATHQIGCFRVNSQILPLKTHPVHGYSIDQLPRGSDIRGKFEQCRDFARDHDLRTCFHPDQFVVLNSQRPEVIAASIAELEYHGEVAEWIGADVINIHGGGAYGNKQRALSDFSRTLDRLSERVRHRLTVENDDKIFSPLDLLPLCQSAKIPFVYDAHHHLCLPDKLSVQEATDAALASWNREPLFHISSPLEGWDGPKPQRHHDYIDPNDLPSCWLKLNVTVEVEAKAKEVAVEKLRLAIAGTSIKPLRNPCS